MGLYLIIALFFYTYLYILEFKYNRAFKIYEENFIIKIISNQEVGDYSNRYIAKIISENNKNYRVYLYTKSEFKYKYGDILKVYGEITLPDTARNDKGFDYSKYLKTKKISALLFSKKEEYITREENFISKIYDLKLQCINIIDNNFKAEEGSILKAILLGDNSSINDETKDIFSESNLSHILAISGFHITYIVFYLEIFLKIVINNIKVRNAVIIFFLVVFVIFVGASPSTMRACFMMIICYIGKIFLKQNDFYRSFIASFIIVLIINPYNIYSISMWFSFMGSFGIVLFSNFFQKVIIKRFRVKNKLIKKILEIIIVSVSAQFMIFPIMWYNFGSLSLTFWISNLLVSGMIAPILIIRLYEYYNISNTRFFSFY